MKRTGLRSDKSARKELPKTQLTEQSVALAEFAEVPSQPHCRETGVAADLPNLSQE